MGKFKALNMLSLAIFLIVTPSSQTACAESWSKNQKVLKSASELEYPPFAIVQPDGTAGGFSVDLLKAATEAVGLSVTFKVGPWNEIKQELAEQGLDVLPLVSYSEERDKVYDFTTSYLRMNGTVFIRESNTEIKTLADLKNKEVLVMQDDTAHEYALKEKLSETIIAKVSYEEAFKLLASGKHDAIVVQQIVGLQMIRKLRLTNVVALEQKSISSLKPMALKLEGFEQNFCFAVPEGNKQLLALLNEGLAIISINGSYNTLYEKWFAPILPKPQVPFSEQVKQLISILVPLLLLATLVGLWYLKRLVAKRTQHLELEIEQRKEVENASKSNITKLEILLGITSLPEASVKTISDHILSSITRLMESEYGFYGFVSEDESIMTIHSWSGEAMENCSMVDKPSDFAICKSGIWAEAVRRREPLIMNNYTADHPAKLGLPTGHVQLTNLLVVPFFSHGRITAVAAVANRSSNYSQDDVAQLTAFLTSVQAITDSKHAEAELRKSEGHLRTLVQTIPDLIWLKDKDGVYLSCNPIFERFFGAKVADIVGKTDYDFVDRELADFFVANDRKALLAGKPTSNEEWITFADDGHRVLLETIKTPMYDNQGTLIGVLGIGRDITERRRAEEENAQLQVQLQQAQKMEAIGTLAGGIAHDFNNILGAILGYAEMVQEDSPAGSMVRKDIDQVVKASYRAKDLVKQILAFSRQAATDHIPLQPGVIIKEALKMLRSSLPTTIDIQQDIDPEAGLILADPTQIHQVTVNLCTNAFHAMEETGGILNISLKKTTLTKADLANESRVQPGDFVQLSIGDTGPGIAPEIREKIFDPYFTTKEVGKGTGMGLAIIHGIAKSYNGFVTCNSWLGEGTVFHVYLPVIADPALLEVETVPLELPLLGNERILFIDDEEILAEMGQTMLERLGYRVTVRRSSIEALNTFQKEPDNFDLVITDQTMPGMTGSDLARRILQIRPGMPIILCTGYSSLISEDKVKAAGIKGFAFKPMTKKDIGELIRKVLDGKNP